MNMSRCSSDIQLEILPIIKFQRYCNDDQRAIKFDFYMMNLTIDVVTLEEEDFLPMIYE